jgi:TadE-like protein
MLIRGLRDRGGQASVELVAAIPALILAILIALQLAVVGYAQWSAGDAARAGARAAYVGGDPGAAAMSALPGPLRERARVSAAGRLRVHIDAPSLLPGLGSIPVTARADLGAGEGRDG